MSIRATQINKSLGSPSVHILHDISLEIQDGEFVSVTGKSGSGKSTLLYLLSTLDLPTSGKVEIGGHDIGQMRVKEIHRFRNQNIGFVFQFHYLLPELTAIENVLMPAMKYGVQEQKRETAISLLKEFELGEKLDRLPGQLSGGEQQRVAIARAMVMGPKYLFADEPTGNLDSKNGNVVMNLLKQASTERRTTVVYVTHDRSFSELADRQIALIDGRLVTEESAFE